MNKQTTQNGTRLLGMCNNCERMNAQYEIENGQILCSSCYGEYADSHSCSAHASSYGYCEQCGAAVYGTSAYIELYGGE